MKDKRKIRLKVIQLRIRAKWSFHRIQRFLERKYDYTVSIKSLRRWIQRYEEGGWDLRDNSRRPHTIHVKITADIKRKVVKLRRMTGWEAWKIKKVLGNNPIEISESSIKRIICEYGLSRGSKMKGERLKWVRWQRDHPDSLWQIDHTENEDTTWTIAVIDDCSRYCFGLLTVDTVTTEIVIEFLDSLTRIHGYPREILTDNGSQYGGKGDSDNEFDKWCKRNKIQHIRAGIKRPTTLGKVERFFGTRDREHPYCDYNDEIFRMRYNHYRPHRSLYGDAPADVYFAFHKRL